MVSILSNSIGPQEIQKESPLTSRTTPTLREKRRRSYSDVALEKLSDSSLNKENNVQPLKKKRVRRWTNLELYKLTQMFFKFGNPPSYKMTKEERIALKYPWDEVAKGVKSRKPDECRRKWRNIESNLSRKYSDKEYNFIIKKAQSPEFIDPDGKIKWMEIMTMFNIVFDTKVENYYLANIYHNAVRKGEVGKNSSLPVSSSSSSSSSLSLSSSPSPAPTHRRISSTTDVEKPSRLLTSSREKRREKSRKQRIEIALRKLPKNEGFKAKRSMLR